MIPQYGTLKYVMILLIMTTSISKVHSAFTPEKGCWLDFDNTKLSTAATYTLYFNIPDYSKAKQFKVYFPVSWFPVFDNNVTCQVYGCANATNCNQAVDSEYYSFKLDLTCYSGFPSYVTIGSTTVTPAVTLDKYNFYSPGTDIVGKCQVLDTNSVPLYSMKLHLETPLVPYEYTSNLQSVSFSQPLTGTYSNVTFTMDVSGITFPKKGHVIISLQKQNLNYKTLKGGIRQSNLISSIPNCNSLSCPSSVIDVSLKASQAGESYVQRYWIEYNRDSDFDQVYVQASEGLSLASTMYITLTSIHTPPSFRPLSGSYLTFTDKYFNRIAISAPFDFIMKTASPFTLARIQIPKDQSYIKASPTISFTLINHNPIPENGVINVYIPSEFKLKNSFSLDCESICNEETAISAYLSEKHMRIEMIFPTYIESNSIIQFSILGFQAPSTASNAYQFSVRSYDQLDGGIYNIDSIYTLADNPIAAIALLKAAPLFGISYFQYYFSFIVGKKISTSDTMKLQLPSTVTVKATIRQLGLASTTQCSGDPDLSSVTCNDFLWIDAPAGTKFSFWLIGIQSNKLFSYNEKSYTVEFTDSTNAVVVTQVGYGTF